MKGKILTLIIGILIGAIIATAGFLIYFKTTSNDSEQNGTMQMDGNGPMGGFNGENGDAPEKPDGDNSEEPPTKPDEDNSTTNTETENSTDSSSNS
jgi:hypothetical protein